MTTSPNVRSYTFRQCPKEAEYRSLLGFAIAVCRHALVVLRPGERVSQKGIELLERLKPLEKRRYQSSKWPGTDISNASATVILYDYSYDLMEILGRAADSFCAWRHPDFPEDLCLMRDESSPWLTTIAHEGDCYLSLTEEEFEMIRRSNLPFRHSMRRDPP